MFFQKLKEYHFKHEYSLLSWLSFPTIKGRASAKFLSRIVAWQMESLEKQSVEFRTNAGRNNRYTFFRYMNHIVLY